MKAKDLISVVIPVYNEEAVLPELYRRLSSVMGGIGLQYEVVFVDDSSTDRSFEMLRALAGKDRRVRAIRFSRNFGHQAALTAGLDASRGAAVITMDADLQHPPEVIPELVRKWKEGYEVVYTVREYGGAEGFFKRTSSAFFYWLIGRLAKTDIPAGAADFRLYDRKVVESLASLKEKTRFLRGLSAWVGFKQTGVGFTAAPRAAGVSKYTVRRMIRFAVDGITSFSILPLKVSIYLGFLVSLLSFAYLVYVLYIGLVTEKAVPGWASTTVSLLFLGGVQLIAIGILGEYVGRIYEEVKGRPTYIITERTGFDEKGEAGEG